MSVIETIQEKGCLEEAQWSNSIGKLSYTWIFISRGLYEHQIKTKGSYGLDSGLSDLKVHAYNH